MTDGAAAGRPSPHPTALSRPFWDGCRQGRLTLQFCEQCAIWIFYPRATCPLCGSTALTWREASGNASVFTYTVARRPTHPKLASQVPYIIAVVQLEEGPRMTSTIIGVSPEDVQIGQEVVVAFEPVGEEFVPVFRPRS